VLHGANEIRFFTIEVTTNLILNPVQADNGFIQQM